MSRTEIEKSCEGCHPTIKVEQLIFRGREIAAPRLCDECLEQMLESERRSEQMRRRRSRIDAAGLPQALRSASFDGFRSTNAPAVEGARRWAKGESAGLVLIGPVGVGKSWLAAAALMDLCARTTVRWISIARMMTQLRGGFDEGRKRASEMVSGAGAVVLDDLDKASPTEFGREILFSTLDNRIQQESPILITTNLEMAEIGERFGDAIMSRLALCERIRMSGDDRRLQR